MAVTEESNLAKKVQEQEAKETNTSNPDEIKFSDEELQSLRDLQDGYNEKQAQFGQLKVQKILLQQQVDSLEEAESKFEEEYTQLQQKEQDLVRTLNEKYGPGNLDPQSGVFTPAPINAEVKEAVTS
tara:strand:- start:854 stop:1234 length:381 start_codon:yes stop_codon:yes gene_type:complete